MKSIIERRNRMNRETGFTLIELLVVILIIGILSAIAIPSFMNQRSEAATASLKADLKNAAIAMETDAVKNAGKYSLTLPTNVPLSKGNNLYLKEQSGSTNVAAGSEIANGEKRQGRTASRYHRDAITGQQALTPSGSFLNGVWKDIYNNTTVDVFGGIYWDYIPSEPLQKGQQISSQVEIKSSNDWCLNKRFEQLSNGANNSITGDAACGVAGEWTTVNMSVITTYDDITRVTATYYMTHKPGEVIEYRKPSIVFGDKISEYVGLSNDSLFCIEGTTDAKKSEFWHYSKVEGGVSEGKC